MACPRVGFRQSGSAKAHLHLLGQFQLRDRNGADGTPHGALGQALLAVLALSPHGKRSRAKLQGLFWSEAGSKQASQNLRTTIIRLRRHLMEHSLNILAVDKLWLQLDLSAVTVDLHRYADGAQGARELRQNFPSDLPEILEGIDLRTSAGDEFEDWLRGERQAWWERLDQIQEAAGEGTTQKRRATGGRQTTSLDRTALQPLAIGLLPSIARHRSSEVNLLGDRILEDLAANLRDIALVEVYDYRSDEDPLLRKGSPPGPLILLRVKTEDGDADDTLVTLASYRSDQAKILWKWSVAIPRSSAAGLETLRFVNEAADRVCESLAASARNGSDPGPFHALNLMFRFDAQSLSAARALIEDGQARSGDPVYAGLRAYLNSFRVGEHWLDYNDEVGAETRTLVAEVLESGSFNSLALALTGHASGYILHDHDLAIDLLERSVRLNGGLAICWDHLALNYLYVGRLDDAESASTTAIRLGAFSPLSFTYDATMCMIKTIRGDYAQAAKYGQRVLARRPSFGAALRYTAVSLAHLGQTAQAGALINHIRSMAPDFSTDWIESNRLAVLDPTAKSRLLLGLRKAGA